MPDQRIHRGPNPEDANDFAPAALQKLARAHADFSWLLSRDYARRSGIKLVGDRYSLTARQRTAVLRCGCSDAQKFDRHRREVSIADIAGQPLWIDGFNLLTTVEAALAGGVILEGRDGCLRDLASMNGHFKHVEETLPALKLIAEGLKQSGPHETHWLLDRPVSNSGRLAELIREAGKEQGWQAELVPDPDPLLASTDRVVATADSAVLDACARWINLAGEIVLNHVQHVWLIHLNQ